VLSALPECCITERSTEKAVLFALLYRNSGFLIKKNRNGEKNGKKVEDSVVCLNNILASEVCALLTPVRPSSARLVCFLHNFGSNQTAEK